MERADPVLSTLCNGAARGTLWVSPRRIAALALTSPTQGGMHTFGLAADVSYAGSPWVRRASSWEALKAAALLVSGASLGEPSAQAFFHALGSDPTGSTGQIYDTLRGHDGELREYFRFASDPAALEAALRARQAAGTTGIFITGEAIAAAARRWRDASSPMRPGSGRATGRGTTPRPEAS
jgi:hypothetical protein